MKGYLKRDDDFQTRRKDLVNLTDEEIKAKFWQLAETLVDPLLDLAKTHTSPAVERSIVLRMGFSSLEAKPIVDGAIERGLIGKGVGNIIYRVSKKNNISIRQAGLELMEGKRWDEAIEIFKGGQK
ncbi:ornithine aminomutase subunit alpha [Helicovermis profundi]|uniref:Ornithine aminomutase subunit alpha n=1 Tax=Helicovermis profundi TaxID=3065157 RepID=A0AAU9EVI7_9FIRM|nr:ornithine aminomutase subunit alpha [Clostridia bacterium S502]